jgi:hypothetical protein
LELAARFRPLVVRGSGKIFTNNDNNVNKHVAIDNDHRIHNNNFNDNIYDSPSNDFIILDNDHNASDNNLEDNSQLYQCAGHIGSERS